MRYANVTDTRPGSVASYIITHCHFLFCGHTVDERPESFQEGSGSLREACEKSRNLCSFPSTILFNLVQPILPWIRELVPGFTICSAEVQLQQA